MTEITHHTENELRNIFISVAYQKDLNLINSTIFMLLSSLIGFGGISIYDLWTDEEKMSNIYMAGLSFFATVLCFIVKILYLTYSSTAKIAQGIDKTTTSIFQKITAN